MPLKHIFGVLGILLTPLAAAQSVVYTTSTTTYTQLVICTTTQYTTTVFDFCPSTCVFPTVTRCTNCQTCSTTLITSPLPNPSDRFTIELTVTFPSGDQKVVLSRIGNTVGIGGKILYFKLSSAGVLSDANTGDTVFVVLPSGAIRKRFEGSVDLLISSNPPAAATTVKWSRDSQGTLKFIVGSSSNPITLDFGVFVTADGKIDTTVPVQMYDLAAGQPSGIEDADGSQSIVTGSITSASQSSQSSITSDSTDSGTSVTSDSTDSSSSSNGSNVSTRTFTITQYGPSPGVSTSTVGSGIVYVIIIRLQRTVTSTLFGMDNTTSTEPFDQYDPTITVFDIISQVITTLTIYGSGGGYTSTPTIGSRFPTLTAVAGLPQGTITNTTYGSVFSTLSLQSNSSAPTVTIYVQFTPTTTITSTTYIPNLYPETVTTLFGTDPTATVLFKSRQYVIDTTGTGDSDFTTTIGPNNPTATVSVQISPTTTFTLQSVTLEWNLTTTSFETVSQTVGYTRTISLHIPYPQASFLRFRPTDAAAGSAQYLTAVSTTVNSHSTINIGDWLVDTGSTSQSQFIQVDDMLILATYPDGTRLPYPAIAWGQFGVSPSGSPLLFSLEPVFDEDGYAARNIIPWNRVDANLDLVTIDRSFYATLRPPGSNFKYDGGAPGPYSLYFWDPTTSAAPAVPRTWSTISTSTLFSFTASAPTAR